MNTFVKKQERVTFSKETYLQWYGMMLLMRQFEERCSQLYVQQKFGGFCHLYIGQEAVMAGIVSAIDKEDKIITAYRDHVHPIALGVHPKYVLAELYGKATGLSKGKGGSMHMFSKERNLYGGHAIVGAQIALGAGIALAEKYKETKNIVICMMGDGAVHQGIFHETMNMAGVWKLPVVFIIENNLYAMGTSVARSSPVTDLYKKGEAYGIPSMRVDGMRCEEVHEAIKNASLNIRNGDGPQLLEIVTYRYRGHSMSDPARYRTRDEIDSFKSRDCIDAVLATIKKNNWITDAELDAIHRDIKNKIDEAVKFAEESPYPSPEELFKDVYKQKDYPFIKG